MKKIRTLAMLILLATFLLTGCELDTIEDTTSALGVMSPAVTTTESNSIPEHTHNFLSADCTTPQTCSLCGEVKGSANGHSWNAATCTEPKTCKVCDKTEGTANGHKYNNGKCTVCEKVDPNDDSQIMVWIPTNGGTKYHSHSGCSNMKNPQQVSKKEAIEMGFEPCKRCH